TLILKAKAKRINQKELVDPIIRTGRLVQICVNIDYLCKTNKLIRANPGDLYKFNPRIFPSKQPF
ncbi:hypothetical protein, partial [Paenibacillus sp. EKM206P]|uniref:hypothetical protein n=1 Tax=Paenibacillus sp. EKM206P TaxID=1683674 RepID=UPI001EEC6E06